MLVPTSTMAERLVVPGTLAYRACEEILAEGVPGSEVFPRLHQWTARYRGRPAKSTHTRATAIEGGWQVNDLLFPDLSVVRVYSCYAKDGDPWTLRMPVSIVRVLPTIPDLLPLLEGSGMRNLRILSA